MTVQAPAAIGMRLCQSIARSGMTELYNPNFPQLGAELALATRLLIPELFQMGFGAREVAAEASVVLLAAPEMAPEVELAREAARELELEPARALEIARSSQWVLSFQPWVFCSGLPPDLVR